MATTSMQGARSRPALGVGYRAVSTGISLVAIWAAATIVAVYSPDMITGSNHEHLQLAMFLAWPVAVIATGMVLLAAGVSRRAMESVGAWGVYAVVNALAWGAAAIVAVFVSPMVTGTDPTTIPLASFIGPIFAMHVTAFASIYIAGAGSAES